MSGVLWPHNRDLSLEAFSTAGLTGVAGDSKLSQLVLLVGDNKCCR